MVGISYDSVFRKKFEKIKDTFTREKVKKQMRKIVEHPRIGKPMMYARKGTREIYIAPYRISYAYVDEKIVFLDAVLHNS